METLEMILGFKENKWYCKDSNFYCEADELSQIDELLKQKLTPYYSGRQVQINLLFDFDSFPLWMRQYMPHYFNRKFIINLT
jgi:hypothetical protein